MEMPPLQVLGSRVLIRPRDGEVSRAFYGEALGLAVAREFPGGVVYFAGNGLIEVSGRAAGDGDPGRDTTLWLQVRSLPDAVARLRDHGVTITREPRREPWGLDECWIADPDGRAIVLVEIPPGHPIRTDVR